MEAFTGVLMAASPLVGFSRREVAAIERAAEVVGCASGEYDCRLADEDRRLFVLLSGRLGVRLVMRQGSHCGGEAETVLERPGDVLGWKLLMKRERLTAAVRCLTPARLLAVDLARMPAKTRLYLTTRLALYLYGQLRWLGLCRPGTGQPEGLSQAGTEREKARLESPAVMPALWGGEGRDDVADREPSRQREWTGDTAGR